MTRASFRARYLALAVHLGGFCEFCTISIALVPTKRWVTGDIKPYGSKRSLTLIAFEARMPLADGRYLLGRFVRASCS